MAWDYFPEGKKIGGTKIIDLIEPTQIKATTLYRVACQRCGSRREITHQELVRRANKGSEQCQNCQNKAEPSRFPEPDRALHAGRHLWWPILQPGGKMGRLHDAGMGANKSIGRGAEV